MVEEIINSLWVEKYRPKNFDDVVLPNDYKNKFKQFIKDGEIPNLMFTGCAGSGKTTCARIIIDSLIDNNCDKLEINGSEDTGVDMIRDIIIPFLSIPPYLSKFKIVYIDEADYLSKNAQASLRHTIEKYSRTTRFIFTLNEEHKIIDALHSRFQKYKFENLPKDFIDAYIVEILNSESISFNRKDLDFIILSEYPDIRKIIQVVQSNCIDDTLEFSVDKINNNYSKITDEILEILKIVQTDKPNVVINKCNSIIDNIQQILNSNTINFVPLYEFLFNHKDVPFWAKIKITESCEQSTTSLVPVMNFVSCIYKIIYTGLSFRSMMKE